MSAPIASPGSSEVLYTIDARFYNVYGVNKDQIGYYRIINLNSEDILKIRLPEQESTKLNKYSFIRDMDNDVSDSDTYPNPDYVIHGSNYELFLSTRKSHSTITIGNFGSDYFKLSSSDSITKGIYPSDDRYDITDTNKSVSYYKKFTFDNVSKNFKIDYQSFGDEIIPQVVEIINSKTYKKLTVGKDRNYTASKNGAKIEITYIVNNTETDKLDYYYFKVVDNNDSVFKSQRLETANIVEKNGLTVNLTTGKIVTVNISNSREVDNFSFRNSVSQKDILNGESGSFRVINLVNVTQKINPNKTVSFSCNGSGTITLVVPSTRNGLNAPKVEETSIDLVSSNVKSPITIDSIFKTESVQNFTRSFTRIFPNDIDDIIIDINSGIFKWKFIAPSTTVNVYFASNAQKDEAILSLYKLNELNENVGTNLLSNSKNYIINDGVNINKSLFIIDPNLHNTSSTPNMIFRNLEVGATYGITFGTAYNDRDPSAVFDDVEICLESVSNVNIGLELDKYSRGVKYYTEDNSEIGNKITATGTQKFNVSPVIIPDIKVTGYKIYEDPENGIPLGIEVNSKSGVLTIDPTIVANGTFGMEFTVEGALGVIYDWYTIEKN